MLCGLVSLAAVLLCSCNVMSGPMRQPVHKMENVSSVTPQMEDASRKNRNSTGLVPTPHTVMASSLTAKHYVQQSQRLSDAEREFVLRRKQVALKALNSLGVMCTLDSVPHIALLGSGGGQRAAVGLIGSLYQMEKEGLLDTLLYLGGISGSAWSMSSLYSDPQWSKNMDRAVSRLSGPGVEPEQAVAWLRKRSKDTLFSLTDIWGVATSAGIMKQLDLRHLSEDCKNTSNPFPIYNAVDKNCLQHGPERSRWFELSPHEVGFTDLGLFINTSHLGSRNHGADPQGKGPEMDMIRLQGIVGSSVANEQSLVEIWPDWLKGLVGAAATDKINLSDLWTEELQQVNSLGGVLDRYMRGYHSLLKLTELIRKNTVDPVVLSGLDNLQKTLKESLNLNPIASFGKKSSKQQKKILEQLHQTIMAPLQTWMHSLDEGPIKDSVSLLIQKVFPLVGKWEWGTTENFLYQYPGAVVPSCIRLKEHLQLIDAGLMLNMPFPPFLGEKRDTDLLITLDYGAGGAFKTLTLARDYAAAVKKPFPQIDDKVLEEKDWPRDLYVFEGRGKEPTIVYMPLFNRRNCKDAMEVKAKMEEYSTFQPAFSPEKTRFVLETAKANVKNNKETMVNEIYKASLRRWDRQSVEMDADGDQ